ncbi:MAG: TIGR01777 family protein [Bacteroidia bacterium]|nr:TIGR01777 family protein [Bacteroidia bacterium]
MKVLIPGGSGLVGRALAKELSARGHSCVVLSRWPAAVSDLPEGVQVSGWDGISAERLRPLLEGVDVVVHLAGENIGAGRWTAARKRAILESRTESSRAVAAAMVGVGNKKAVLIQASAVGFYGPRKGEEVSETGSAGNDFLARVCRDWEAASESVVEAGLRRVVIRTGVVLSADGGALPKMVLPFRLFAGGPLGSGSQFVPWIHLDDEIAAIYALLEDPEARGPFNLVAPGAVTNRQLGREIGRVLGRPSLVPTPAFALRVALGEMSTLLLDGQRVVPKRLLDSGFEFRFPELEPALRDLLGSSSA